jgi:arginase
MMAPSRQAKGLVVTHVSNTFPKTIALLGVPIEVGASQKGALMGPAALRTAGLSALLESLGFAVEDHGDLGPRDLTFITESTGSRTPRPTCCRRWVSLPTWEDRNNERHT